MRHIDTSHINVPTNWVVLAKAKLGNSYSSLWSYFKEEFEAIAGKKCWYSESINIGAVNPIDHFRPQATDLKNLPSSWQKLLDNEVWIQIDHNIRMGYPFLKHEFSNYRYACTIVNSQNKQITNDNITRGKSNIFPIKSRSLHGTCINTITQEEIGLIDPCVESDVELLRFNNLGFIEPNIQVLDNSWEYCRVKISIEVYHLHYADFKEARIEIWNTCEQKIKFMSLYYSKATREKPTDLERESFQNCRKELTNKMEKNEQFSAVAIDCIRHHQNTYIWIKHIFPSLEK